MILSPEEHAYLEERLQSEDLHCRYRDTVQTWLLTLKLISYLFQQKISVRPWGKMRPLQDCIVESELFDCEQPICLTLNREEWEDGPQIAIARELAEAVMQGSLHLTIPDISQKQWAKE